MEFAAQFNQSSKALYAFAYKLTQNEEEAKDLLQETAYKAFKNQNSFQPKTNLGAWLMAIMRNTFINNYRQKSRRQTLSGQVQEQFPVPKYFETAANEGELTVSMEELQKIIDGLVEWARIPFLMHYQGYRYEEIAKQLDLPLGTVKSRIHFSRRFLQKEIKKAFGAGSVNELMER